MNYSERRKYESNSLLFKWKRSKWIKEEEETKLKKQRQDEAKKEINDFLKNRQAEVEELKLKNQANNVYAKSDDPLKNNVK